jgi:hypothetical protein
MHFISKALGAAAIACALIASPTVSQAQGFGTGGGHHHGGNWSGHGGGGNWGGGGHGDYWGGGHDNRHYNGGNSFSFSFSVSPNRRSGWAAHIRRCERAYRTYDWRTDTYIARGGHERRCRL